MPNWCYNNVRIMGSKNDIDNIIKKYTELIRKEVVLCSEKIIPYPRDYLLKRAFFINNNDDDNKMKEIERLNVTEKEHKQILLWKLNNEKEIVEEIENFWYDWNRLNWGSKWGICNCSDCNIVKMKHDKLSIQWNFETAWSCATPFVEQISKDYPNVKIYYSADEESRTFKFESVWKNGQEVRFKDLLK